MTLLIDDFTEPLDEAEARAQRELVRAALDDGLLQMYFQPIVTDRGMVIAAEALARIPTDEGMVTPGKFLAAIEGTDLMRALDLQAFALSCAAAARLAVEFETPPVITCNFSATTLVTADLADLVLGIVANNGIDPSQMCLEVTETVVFEAGEAELRRMYDAGLGIALDNFGTGYAQLAGLRDLSLTCVKVDRSFIAALDKSATERAFAITVLDLAMSLGIPVMAEGVENASQWRSARKYGLTMMQGWFHSMPMPLEDFVARVVQSGAAPRLTPLEF